MIEHTDLANIAGFFASSDVRMTELYWVDLEEGFARDDFLTPAPGFLYILQGVGRFTFGDAGYLLRPGEVLHGGGDTRMAFSNAGQNKLQYCLIHYALLGGESSVWTQRHYRLQPGPEPVITGLLLELRSHQDTPGALAELRRRFLLYQLIHETLTCCERSKQPSGYENFVQDAIAYIQSHYAEPLTLSDLSARYGVSRGFFSAQFRKIAGISPIDYLIGIRIRRAKELLSFSGSSVKEIAKSVGYTDMYYFSRLFKKHTSQPPSSFRPQGD
ncbi:helix-turn-helix domain-containing protein [Paenibacillus sp. 1P07SE]|uniref:AraC family transcriptional regulator n=1 Tax=Paenibacillus sp. 1P07SE TaxID=3132209 RepID=UPI0039A432DC